MFFRNARYYCGPDSRAEHSSWLFELLMNDTENQCLEGVETHGEIFGPKSLSVRPKDRTRTNIRDNANSLDLPMVFNCCALKCSLLSSLCSSRSSPCSIWGQDVEGPSSSRCSMGLSTLLTGLLFLRLDHLGNRYQWKLLLQKEGSCTHFGEVIDQSSYGMEA